jgi:16S rRNA processing protein RimM
MTKDDCFYLGIIARKHSYKGEIVIALDTDEPEIYANLEAVFIELNNKLIPFFVENIKLQKGNQLRIKFEGVNTEKEAEIILKRATYLPLTSLPKLDGDKFYFHEVIGFTIEDINFGTVGKIVSINDNTSQHLFVINNGDTQILIPLIDEFIKKVDRKQQKIIVETPEGLIQMYLD